jgi:hypothetical protein
VTVDDAVQLIGGAGISSDPATWADLGAGDGTFTLALAAILPPGSIIHAIDQDISALGRIQKPPAGTSIVPHAGDFTTQPWPFTELDGVHARELDALRPRSASPDQRLRAEPEAFRALSRRRVQHE